MQSKWLEGFFQINGVLMVMDIRLHGSGTAIGDALELEGINMARTELNAEKVPITVGSNKGNLGNCEVCLYFLIGKSAINTFVTGCRRTCFSNQDVQINSKWRCTCNAIIREAKSNDQRRPPYHHCST